MTGNLIMDLFTLYFTGNRGLRWAKREIHTFLPDPTNTTRTLAIGYHGWVPLELSWLETSSTKKPTHSQLSLPLWFLRTTFSMFHLVAAPMISAMKLPPSKTNSGMRSVIPIWMEIPRKHHEQSSSMTRSGFSWPVVQKWGPGWCNTSKHSH